MCLRHELTGVAVTHGCLRFGSWFFSVAAALLVVAGLGACSTAVDDDGDFPVYVVNDTAQPIVVWQCSDTCPGSTISFSRALLVPRGTLRLQASGDSVDNYHLVRYMNGSVVGCLDLKFNSYRKSARMPITRARSCRGEVSSGF